MAARIAGSRPRASPPTLRLIAALGLLLVLTSRAYAPGTRPDRILAGHSGAVWSVAFSPDGKTLASGGRDGLLTLWDLESGRPRWRAAALGGEINTVAFAPDGKRLAAGSDDGRIRLWDPRKGRLEKTLSGHALAVSSMAYSPDGKTLASGSYDRTVRLWDARKGKPRTTLEPAARREVWSVAFASDGKTLSAGSGDEAIRIWDLEDPKRPRLLHEISGQGGEVWALAASPRERWMASGLWSGTFNIWAPQSDASSPMAMLSATSLGPQVWALAMAPAGARVAVGSGVLGQEGALEIWDAFLSGPIWGQPLEHAAVTALAFSPDGEMLAAGRDNGDIDLWRLEVLPFSTPAPVLGVLSAVSRPEPLSSLTSGDICPSAPPPPMLSGVGIALSTASGLLVLEAVLPGSPAAQIGLRPGEQLLAVDGVSISGLSVEAITERIRGSSGSQLTLTVQDGQGALSVPLTRAPVVLPRPTPASAP